MCVCGVRGRGREGGRAGEGRREGEGRGGKEEGEGERGRGVIRVIEAQLVSVLGKLETRIIHYFPRRCLWEPLPYAVIFMTEGQAKLRAAPARCLPERWCLSCCSFVHNALLSFFPQLSQTSLASMTNAPLIFRTTSQGVFRSIGPHKSQSMQVSYTRHLRGRSALPALRLRRCSCQHVSAIMIAIQ